MFSILFHYPLRFSFAAFPLDCPVQFQVCVFCLFLFFWLQRTSQLSGVVTKEP